MTYCSSAVRIPENQEQEHYNMHLQLKVVQTAFHLDPSDSSLIISKDFKN